MIADFRPSLFRADTEPARLRGYIGNALQSVDASDFAGLAHAGREMTELTAKLRVVPVDRHHVRRLALVAADRDELRLGEIGGDLLHRRDKTPGMAHDDPVALVGVVAQSFGFIRVGDVFRIGRLEAVRLEALQDRVAERVPALIVGASGQQNRRFVFRVSGGGADQGDGERQPARRRRGATRVKSSWNEPLLSLGRPRPRGNE